MLADLILQNRSCRRFHEDRPVSRQTLTALVDMARLSASAANLQPLRYILSNRAEINAQVFSCLGWAAYLTDWPGPATGERPPAYLIMISDTEIGNEYIKFDAGIAGQSILLRAREMGLAGCLLGAVNREKLRNILQIPQRYDIILVIAVGEPAEEAVIDPVGADGDIRYFRDDKGVHHVPKRALSDVILAAYEK
jgi:nitroreductase